MLRIWLEVEGMHCGMCESCVNDAVRGVDGVKKVKSSHSKGRTVVIADDKVNPDDIAGAISALGYKVGATETSPYVKRGLFGRSSV